jgi:hypothetical protein
VLWVPVGDDGLGKLAGAPIAKTLVSLQLHGVGLTEAWVVLEPYIRREREIRAMRYAVIYEDLVCRSGARPPMRKY